MTYNTKPALDLLRTITANHLEYHKKFLVYLLNTMDLDSEQSKLLSYYFVTMEPFLQNTLTVAEKEVTRLRNANR